MSTLKVNTIQNLSNIDVSNKIIQVVTSTTTSQVLNATSNWVSTGLSASITPRSSTSKFLVLFEGSFFKQTSAGGGFGVNIYKNGSAVTTSSSDATDRPYDYYKDETRLCTRVTKSYIATTGSTSISTFEVYFKSYGGTDNLYFNNIGGSSGTASNLVVMEVL